MESCVAFAVIRAGAEARVNTTLVGDQRDPSLAKLADGGWVVTWQSVNQDGSGLGVYQQRYNPDGSAHGNETKVNTWTDGDQNFAVVTALADGGWVVAWHSAGNVHQGEWEASSSIYQQHYRADGSPAGTETRVNTTIAGHQIVPSIAVLADGGWVVTWQSESPDGLESNIYQQRYDADGTPRGSETLVNSTTTDDQGGGYVTALADGGWVVSWASAGQDGSGYGSYHQRYNADGTVHGAETQVNTTTANNQLSPRLAAVADGGWVAVWQSLEQDGSASGVYLQRYDADGSPRGAETQVNTTTAGTQGDVGVTALADGGWIVTWTSSNQDGSGFGIYQQTYRADGTTSGPEILVNGITAGHQTSSSVAAVGNGRWIVTWSSRIDGNDEVHQRLFAIGDTLTDAVETATGTEADETLVVEAGGLDAGDVLDGRGGRDTLEAGAAGILDLTLLQTLTSFEIVRGSHGDDVITADANRLAQFDTIDGRGGTDALRLTGGGAIDLRSKILTGLESIVLADAAGTRVTLAGRETALLLDGTLGADDAVVLVNGTFTPQERLRLFAQGIETVTDARGTVTHHDPTGGNVAPNALSLSGSSVLELVSSGAVVGTLAAADPDGHESFTYTLVDSAGGCFRIVGNQLLVDNGFKLDFEQVRSHRITVQVADSIGATRTWDFDLAVADLPVERTGGSAFDDVFKAGKHNDVLGGGLGNDRLWGGPGKDTLTGGKGKDVFVFDSKPNRKTNLDRVKDYTAKDDAIWLENRIFTKLGKQGTELRPKTLNKAFFAFDTAKDGNDYLIYVKQTGRLYYDGDGSGAKVKAVEIATFATKPNLKFTEFFII
jgi:hypothetical protein